MKLKSEAQEFDTKGAGFTGRISDWAARHPVMAIVFVSLVAVAINCYPVVFLGKSFVAPAYGVPMLYERYPTLPGMDRTEPVVAHGSDTAATLVWGVPVGFIESRSLREHGELPLWNRYSHAGEPLIGQAISMMGDPLQLIVLAGNGSALAQDLKFLVAKLLFCIGFGLLIRRLLGSTPLALLFAAMAAYCGAYYFIYNHPAFFVFSYTPWILLSSLELLNLQSKNYIGWGLAWLLVNFGCFNGGHVELAIILIGGLNFVALVFSLAANRGTLPSVKILTRLAMGTGIFLALTCPIWIAFLQTLSGAFTIHEGIHVVQFPFASLLGIFDDVFFRLPVSEGPFSRPAPGCSFLIFVGCVYSFVRWQMLRREIFFWVNTGAILLWGGLVFGWIPGAVIAAIPMLNREAHTHTDFSYLLVIHLTIQCAYGFRCLAREATFRRSITGLSWVVLVLCGMTLLYCFGIAHSDIPWIYFFPVVAGAFAAPLLFAFLRSRAAITALGMTGVILLGFLPHFRFGLYDFGNNHLLMVPGKRVTFDAPSTAINWVKADRSTAFRIAGAEIILFGDYSAVYGLENIFSCEPLSNGELVSLIRGSPGIATQFDWETDLTNIVAAHALLNLLNVKYVITPPEVTVQDGLGFRLAHTSDLGVLENLDVWPRAFFSDAVVSLGSTNEFIAYLLQHGKQPFIGLTPEEMAKQPELLPLRTNLNPTIAPATHYTLLPNSTAFDVYAASAGVVCLTEGQARDFTATANGELKTVLTVNRAFKGIYLNKPGDYHITFTYRPRHWRLACTLFWTAIGLVVILAGAGFYGGRCKKIEVPPNPDIQSA